MEDTTKKPPNAKRNRAMSICSENPSSLEPSVANVDPKEVQREAYIKFLSSQLKNTSKTKQFLHIRDDLVKICYAYRQYRRSLADIAVRAKEIYLNFRTVVGSTSRSIRSSFSAVFPKSSIRINDMSNVKLNDMTYECNLINQNKHDVLDDVNDIGTLKENVLGNFMSIDDPLIGLLYGIVVNQEEETKHNKKFIDDNNTDDEAMMQACQKITEAKFLKKITSLNFYKLATEYVNDVESLSSSSSSSLSKADKLAHIFSLLPDPGLKTAIRSIWEKNYKDNEKKFYDQYIVGEKRITCDLTSPRNFLKQKTFVKRI